MNKKILVLAFVSAAFFFGCSADGRFSSGIEPPAWDGTPSTIGPSTGEPSGGAGYCRYYDDYEGKYFCEPIPSGFTAQDCIEYFDGEPVNNCNGY